MAYLSVNSIRMYYEEEGNGLPLVLLHGGTSTIDSGGGWIRLRPDLSAHYRCVFVEHRGHGRTDNSAGRITYAMIAEDVCRLIEQLGLAPAHLAGMSDGGIAGLQIALLRPELLLSLVGVGVNYRVDDTIRQIAEDVLGSLGSEEDPELERMHDLHKWAGYWRELVRQVAENWQVNPDYTTEDLQRIQTPVLLISGERDPFGSLEQVVEMRRSIPHSELLILNNADHLVHDTHPHLVGPAILDFLSRHTTGSATDEAAAG